MNVAVIGGTRHVGPDIVRLLIEAGHEVSIYSRGRSKVQLRLQLGSLPERIRYVRPRSNRVQVPHGP